MERVLIIGGTGNVGRHVVTQLSGSGTQVRALARNPATARLPPEVEVVRGDLTVPESLDRCLDGIDTVFLVWVAPPALPDQLWRRLRGTPGGSYTFQLRSKHRTRSFNSPIHPERWPNGSND
jgi:nucleoside-diphosphate-sugar epimerase